jgi:hypothetical protein
LGSGEEELVNGGSLVSGFLCLLASREFHLQLASGYPHPWFNSSHAFFVFKKNCANVVIARLVCVMFQNVDDDKNVWFLPM